jgi:hypothetical protein
MTKWLWLLVIIGLLASLPLAYKRVQTERSTKNVEIVFDYRDLLEASQYKPNSQAYIQQQLKLLKEAGVGSMAVYEATLEELKNSRSIQLFTANEYAGLTGKLAGTADNHTYLLFTSEAARTKLQGMIENVYRQRLNVDVSTWSYNNQTGLIIALPYEEANTKPLPPDPITLDMLHNQHQFQIVARLSNRMQPFTTGELDATLKNLSSYGVKRIVFDGVAVTGYDEEKEKSNIAHVIDLMNKYQIGTGAIERLKAPQSGFTVSFVNKLQGNAVRVFPLFETEANLKPDKIADKLVLAVKDRDIRMIFLNTKAAKDTEKGFMNDYMTSIIESLTGPQGAIERIEKAGYQIGEAHAFVEYGKSLNWLKLLLLAGGTALIALTIGYFVRSLVTVVFVLGIVGVFGLYGLSSSIALQATAFGVGVCAPTWATLSAIRSLDRRRLKGATPSVLKALVIFLRTTVLTLVGIAYVVGLLSGLSYYLVLEQFRGVALLHMLPIVLVGLYVLLFNEQNGLRGAIKRVRVILSAKISILWVTLAGVMVLGLWYYLSRTGNEGQASELEKVFRAVLEDTLGVRPRTKEFLFAHPLFILGAYLLMKYKHAAYLFAGAVMGQLSLVDTFAHLHTPLYISLTRITYGVLIGLVIGIVYIAVWELLARSWKRWSPYLFAE